MATAPVQHSRRAILAGLGGAALTSATARAQVGGASPAPLNAAPTPADLRSDVAIVRAALALHPGLYRYNTPGAMAERLTAFETAFVGAPDSASRYLVLARLLATIRCGHSYPNFYNQKETVRADLFDRPTRLPFRFDWIGGQMVVTRDDSGSNQLARGSVVTAINGVTPADMRQRLLPYIRADGHNDAKRVSLLAVRGDDTIETFDVFQGLVYGAPQGGTHRVSFLDPAGTRRTVVVAPISMAARTAAGSTPPDDTGPVWQWSMTPDGIAVLTMPGWGLYNSKWDWQGWLGDRLASLAGAKGLIVDLRANEGGLDCGNPILARLANRDIHPVDYVQKLRFQRTPPSIDRYLDTWDDSFRTLGVGAKPLPGGFFERLNADAVLTIPAVGPRLILPVAILVGPVNSSATFQFALTAKSGGLAKLFGAPTGGNLRGINGGAFFFVRLPASGLEFDVPLIGYFASGRVADAGITPDVAVMPTAADIANGRDPVLTSALGWIARA